MKASFTLFNLDLNCRIFFKCVSSNLGGSKRKEKQQSKTTEIWQLVFQTGTCKKQG